MDLWQTIPVHAKDLPSDIFGLWRTCHQISANRGPDWKFVLEAIIKALSKSIWSSIMITIDRVHLNHDSHPNSDLPNYPNFHTCLHLFFFFWSTCKFIFGNFLWSVLLPRMNLGEILVLGGPWHLGGTIPQSLTWGRVYLGVSCLRLPGHVSISANLYCSQISVCNGCCV